MAQDLVMRERTATVPQPLRSFARQIPLILTLAQIPNFVWDNVPSLSRITSKKDSDKIKCITRRSSVIPITFIWILLPPTLLACPVCCDPLYPCGHWELTTTWWHIINSTVHQSVNSGYVKRQPHQLLNDFSWTHILNVNSCRHPLHWYKLNIIQGYIGRWLSGYIQEANLVWGYFLEWVGVCCFYVFCFHSF